MAIHHPTPPLGGGERPRLPSACRSVGERHQAGPVTQAIRAMRAADDNAGISGIQNIPVRNNLNAFTHGIHTVSRTEVEDLIGGLIDLLDAMNGGLKVGEAA